MESQLSWIKSGVIWSSFLEPVMSLAETFRVALSGANQALGSPARGVWTHFSSNLAKDIMLVIRQKLLGSAVGIRLLGDGRDLPHLKAAIYKFQASFFELLTQNSELPEYRPCGMGVVDNYEFYVYSVFVLYLFLWSKCFTVVCLRYKYCTCVYCLSIACLPAVSVL